MYPAHIRRSDQPRASLHITHRTDRSSRECLENADLAARMAASAATLPDRNRYKRIEDGWRALAEMQDWLDGRVNPVKRQASPTSPATSDLPDLT